MWFLNRTKGCKHDYKTVAYDCGFKTNFTDTSEVIKHHLFWKKCSKCGDRTFEHDSKKHAGVTQVKLRWIECNKIVGTTELDVYDPDYSQKLKNQNWMSYEYKPMSGIECLMNHLKTDQEFRELYNKHQMVQDAYDELETVIKMHENIDKS